MFTTVEEISSFYNSGIDHRNKITYDEFEKNASNDSELCCIFNNTNGYGELPFCWSWKLLVDCMPTEFKFLEVGINNGRMLSVVAVLSQREGKNGMLYGIRPSTVSTEIDDKYIIDISNNYTASSYDISKLNIINGSSQDTDVIEQVMHNGPYNIVSINNFYGYQSISADIEQGIDRYNNILQDMNSYSSMLNVNGYLIMNDASLYIGCPYGNSFGDTDMSQVATNVVDNMANFVKVYNIGHNRVWQKISE